MPRYREEVFNVYLAELLRDRGVISVPESITTQGRKRGRKPQHGERSHPRSD